MSKWILLMVALLGALGCRAKATPLTAPTPGNGTPPNPVYLCDTTSGSSCNLLGNAGNPVYVTGTGGGGSTTISGAVAQGDGGGIANSWAVQLNDGTNLLGTTGHPVQVEGVTGSVVTVSGTVSVLIDAGQTVVVNGAGMAGSPAGGVTTVQGVSGGTALPVDTTAGDELNVFVAQNSVGTAQVLVDAGTRYVLDVNVTNEGWVNGWWQLFCGQYTPDAGGTSGASTVPTLQIRCPAGALCGQLLKAPLSCAGGVWYSSSTVGVLTTASAPNMTLTAAAIR